METKANHILVGSFVLAVLVAAALFVRWMQDDGVGGAGQTYGILFPGAIGNLHRTSDVLFNGVPVGKVSKVAIYGKDPRKVEVLVRVRADTPLYADSEVRIIQRGLTGLSAIMITPGPQNSEPLAKKSDEKFAYLSAAEPVTPLMDAAPKTLANANAAFERINRLIESNEAAIRHTIKNIENLSTALNDSSSDIAQTITDAREAVAAFKALSKKLDKVTEENVDKLTRRAKRSLNEFELLMKDGRRAADRLERVLAKIERDPQSLLFGSSDKPEE